MHIPRLRLLHQHIARPVLDDPAAVVAHLGAIQAQDYLGALWGIGLRCRKATEATVEDAVARRAIVRTWPMRGTLHFVAAADARWMLQLLTPRVVAASASRHRQLGLDAAVFARAGTIAERVLAGAPPLRRDALYRRWNDAGIATHDARGLHLLGVLAQHGLLCFGPRVGKQQTFTLLEEWLPPATPIERDEALAELARRYFTSHGPATVHDFAWWSGLTVTDARAGLEDAKGALVSDTVGARTLWLAPGRGRRPPPTGAYLLPAWDEFTVAYRDRTDILAPAHTTRVNAGGGVLRPVIVIDGEVVGTWQRTLGKSGVIVRPSYFDRPTRMAGDAVRHAAEQYAKYLSSTAVVQ